MLTQHPGMAKYSTGGGRSEGGGDSCELCGKTTDDLELATVAGAELLLCPDCAPHDERSSATPGSSGSRDDGERRRQAARNTAQLADAAEQSAEHWIREGTNYDDDPLPYLVSNYGERLEAARQDAGYQRDELAQQLGIQENQLLAIEQGRATQANVGGSVIRRLERVLDITLIDE